MQDRQLYQQILGIPAPWSVERVELRLEDGEVHVYLDHEPRADWACPECGARVRVRPDGERSWRIGTPGQYARFCTRRPPASRVPRTARVGVCHGRARTAVLPPC